MRRRSRGTSPMPPPRPLPSAASKSEGWEITHSGNSVSLEQELIKAGEVNRAYKLNTGIAKAFHRMLLASAKV